MIKKISPLILSLVMAAGAMSAKPKAGHLVFIGLDAWGSYSVEKADMPVVKEMMKNGSYTLRKRCVRPSESAPNWASMFMGVGPELHGYTHWGSKHPDFPPRLVEKHNIFPTIFQIMRDQRPDSETGVLYEWDGIKFLVDTLSLSHHALAEDAVKNPSRLCEMAEEYIVSAKPDFVAICFDEPDHTGHAIGHDTEAFYSKMNELDGYVGRIVEATKKAGIYDDTIFIVTADHGGIGTRHGGNSLVEMETPFVIFGKGISGNGEFQESMMQFDVAATMADILDVVPPQVWIGRSMTQVFE